MLKTTIDEVMELYKKESRTMDDEVRLKVLFDEFRIEIINMILTKKVDPMVVNTSSFIVFDGGVEYYNTKSQLLRIVGILDTTFKVDELLNKLKTMYKEEKIKDLYGIQYLNNKTLEVLKYVLDELSIKA